MKHIEIEIADFRIKHKAKLKLKLKKRATRIDPYYRSKKDYEQQLATQVEALSKFQNLHYAANSSALLLILQGMDAAGKDSTIKHVMSGVNPQGCQVSSFKHPSGTELQHDFLWRTTQRLPERGQIGIFNRSYYEEVLITRVHPEILKGEGLDHSTRPKEGKPEFWEERYHSITQFERHLQQNGTRVIKIFLHLSPDEQKKRFLARIDNPDKNWKLSVDDLKERAYWKEYQSAYEDCISATSTAHSPWYVVPADDKLNTRLIVSRILLDHFRSCKMAYPKLDLEQESRLKAMRRQLTRED